MKWIAPFIVLFFSFHLGSRCQVFDTTMVIELDAVEIDASNGFSSEDFIEMMKNDTSFYKSFKNTWVIPHQSNTFIQVYDKEDETKATCRRKSSHHHYQDSSWVVIKNETVTGKYYKKGEPKYYTSQMFDQVFFPKDTIYYPSSKVEKPYTQNEDWSSRSEKHYEQLKTFIFSPGSNIEGVPFIGKKMEIFSKEMRPLYRFEYSTEVYNGIECYVFECHPKKDTAPDDIVITHLKSYFDKSTFSLVYRDYNIKHETILFDFDIRIIVKIDKVGDLYLPASLNYQGWWKLPFKKPEIMSFEMIMHDYEVK